MVTLAELKTHLRIDDDLTAEDTLIEAYKGAAIAHIQNLTEQDFSTLMPEPIKHAIKLLVGHWYKNREATTETKQQEIPHAVDALIQPYKKVTISGVEVE